VGAALSIKTDKVRNVQEILDDPLHLPTLDEWCGVVATYLLMEKNFAQWEQMYPKWARFIRDGKNRDHCERLNKLYKEQYGEY
jgi:hypothetical protein